MKKATLLIVLLFGFTLNAQSFKYDKSIKDTNVDLIHISSLKKRILGIEHMSLETFVSKKDSIMTKYYGKTTGDESVYYEIGRSHAVKNTTVDLNMVEYISFYVYDYEVTGNIRTDFKLKGGTYSFEFYLNNRIFKTYIAKVKGRKIVNKIDNTSEFDFYNNYTEN